MSVWPDERPFDNLYLPDRTVTDLEVVLEARRPHGWRERIRAFLAPTVCRCGHSKDAHAHYRRATDCGLACDCGHYTPRRTF